MQFNYNEIQYALTLYIWKNDHLREEFIKYPKQAIEKYLKFKIKNSIPIKIINLMDPYELFFILPAPFPFEKNEELTEEELDKISCGDEFEDYYHHPSTFNTDIIKKTKILINHQKQENLLKFEQK